MQSNEGVSRRGLVGALAAGAAAASIATPAASEQKLTLEGRYGSATVASESHAITWSATERGRPGR
jgi:hypothetical protein